MAALTLPAVAGAVTWIPFSDAATAWTTSDITSLSASLDGVAVASPMTALDISLTSTDSVNGTYALQVITKHTGTYFVHFLLGSTVFDFVLMSTKTSSVPTATHGNYLLTVSNGSSALPGVSATLYSADGSTLIRRTTSDALGVAAFYDLPVGNYQVRLHAQGIDFSASNPISIRVTAADSVAPAIASVFPTSAAIGDTVVLRGSTFGPTPSVFFGSVQATSVKVNVDEDLILAVLPIGLVDTVIPVTVQKPTTPSGVLASSPTTLVRI